MIGWNDRRKARQAERATTRAQIGAMAKSGTLRAAKKPTPAQTAFNKTERAAVKSEAEHVSYRDPKNTRVFGKPTKAHYEQAAKNVEADPERTGYSWEAEHYYRTGNKVDPKTLKEIKPTPKKKRFGRQENHGC